MYLLYEYHHYLLYLVKSIFINKLVITNFILIISYTNRLKAKEICD